jgi:hypothetical protein
MFARRKFDRDALRAVPSACDLQAFIAIQSCPSFRRRLTNKSLTGGRRELMLSDQQVCPHPRYRFGSVALASAQTTRSAYRDATTWARPQPRVQQPQRITRLTTARPTAVTIRIRPATREKTCVNS